MQEPDARPRSSCGEQEPATAVRRWIQANCNSDGVVALCHRPSGRGLVLLARHASHRACLRGGAASVRLAPARGRTGHRRAVGWGAQNRSIVRH